jgi:hypothetical protein
MSTLVTLSDEELDAVTGGFLNFRDINVAIVEQSGANVALIATKGAQQVNQGVVVTQIS